jgi:hypothetical protein
VAAAAAVAGETGTVATATGENTTLPIIYFIIEQVEFNFTSD